MVVWHSRPRLCFCFFVHRPCLCSCFYLRIVNGALLATIDTRSCQFNSGNRHLCFSEKVTLKFLLVEPGRMARAYGRFSQSLPSNLFMTLSLSCFAALAGKDFLSQRASATRSMCRIIWLGRMNLGASG